MLALLLQTQTSLLDRSLSLIGVFVCLGLAYLMSVNRSKVNWKVVLWGIALQFIFGLIVLHPTMQQFFFDGVSSAVGILLSFSEEAAHFVFGTMTPHNISVIDPATGQASEKFFIGKISPPTNSLAFVIIIPTIIFFSSLMSILYQLGIMQKIVSVLAIVMQRTMGTTGPESLSAAANIFVGQTEAPLVIKPYISKMTSSEIHAVMTGGFATVAGGVMAAYVGFLQNAIPSIAGHLVAASIMSAPAALALSKVVWPMNAKEESSQPTKQEEKKEQIERIEDETTMAETHTEGNRPYGNIVEAAAIGASEGMKLALNVLGMLIAFVGLIALINWGLSLVPIGNEPLTLQKILGWAFSPLAFTMGIPWSECQIVGSLLGEKIAMTEFVAYLHLAEILNSPEPLLSERSAIITSYALCGFANFASIGIQIGGIGGIAPERIPELSQMGIRAMLAGTLAACMTGTIAGVLIG